MINVYSFEDPHKILHTDGKLGQQVFTLQMSIVSKTAKKVERATSIPQVSEPLFLEPPPPPPPRRPVTPSLPLVTIKPPSNHTRHRVEIDLFEIV
ncbi:unnamed protein product [Danaus chrysippus]|uniref:(African queen) hypothetical protein n=1 Tax=Danaus chrysippus TaxID=151541 RepID=A0A8J2WDE2_9NEOP|nr:unnamed protein product [Danaus chrysippus]